MAYDNAAVGGYSRLDFEIMSQDAKERFNQFRADWVEQLLWTTPKRAMWLLGNDRTENIKGYPIIDPTHILAQRSMVAGFSEGNTSATRPWLRYAHPDTDLNTYEPVRRFLQKASDRALMYLQNSNFYNQAGQFYYDYSSVDTGCHIFKRINGGIHVYTLMPGSYFVIQNALHEPEALIREFSLHAVALVKRFGKKVDGKWDWSIFSNRVKELYDKSDTNIKIELREIITRNKDFQPEKPVGGRNRQWFSVIYETGVATGSGFAQFINDPTGPDCKNLEVSYYRTRPFVVGKQLGDSPYGEIGSTSGAIGAIRSINKKAISKDIALEKLLEPTTQGPGHIRKSYLTTQARKHIPLDATAMTLGGVKPIYEIRGEGIAAVVGDVADNRQQIEKFYYADFLLYLSNNPKTRTAEETRAIVEERQMVLGPALQTLNWSYNIPISEYMLDFVLNEDPVIGEMDIPEELQGEFIKTEFLSVFAQVQRAFDLPQINQYVSQWLTIAQLNPQAWNNINLNELARIYEDRYYLPVGLNNPQSKVDALMRQAQQQQMRQQMIEALPAAAQASKNQAEAQQIRQQG